MATQESILPTWTSKAAHLVGGGSSYRLTEASVHTRRITQSIIHSKVH